MLSHPVARLAKEIHHPPVLGSHLDERHVGVQAERELVGGGAGGTGLHPCGRRACTCTAKQRKWRGNAIVDIVVLIDPSHHSGNLESRREHAKVFLVTKKQETGEGRR